VRFWDSSAVVPLLVDEDGTLAARAELEDDPSMVVWWSTGVECVSAIARREREGLIKAGEVSAVTEKLTALAESWEEVQPAERVRRAAVRLVRVHPLRTADAFQLAAAIIAADDDPHILPFVTLDERLARAAEREGFPVVQPA
jgi:predicted nucleic acid-binding protein